MTNYELTSELTEKLLNLEDENTALEYEISELGWKIAGLEKACSELIDELNRTNNNLKASEKARMDILDKFHELCEILRVQNFKKVPTWFNTMIKEED